MSRQVQIITDLTAVPESALFERLSRAASLPVSQRASLSVQLRDPGLSVRELLRLGHALRRITREIGARLIVNDRVDVALLVEADGVHLGRRSLSVEDARALLGPSTWISTSAHSVEDVLVSARTGANAALLSPIFASPGKSAPVGVVAIARAREALSREGLSLALFALGGIDVDNAPLCFEAGAVGVAAIRADLLSCLALA